MEKDTRLTLSSSTSYDKGVQNSIAINNNSKAVEIHKSENKDILYCRCADFSVTPIRWSKSVDFDTGILPTVTVHDSTVVELHQSEKTPDLYYRVGDLSHKSKSKNTTSVKWGSSHHYDTGKSPSVSICQDGVYVVEVHEAHTTPKLWYRVGKVDMRKKKIDWGSSHEYDSGLSPSVVWLPNTDLVVGVHKSERRDVLYYRIGKVCKSDKKIDWSSSKDYDTGIAPKVSAACFRGGEINLIEVHQSETRNKMYYRIGKVLKEEGVDDSVKSFVVEWGDSVKYDSGVVPAVAMNDHVAVVVHKSENYDKLYFHYSLIPKIVANVVVLEGSSSGAGKPVVAASDDVVILKAD